MFVSLCLAVCGLVLVWRQRAKQAKTWKRSFSQKREVVFLPSLPPRSLLAPCSVLLLPCSWCSVCLRGMETMPESLLFVMLESEGKGRGKYPGLLAVPLFLAHETVAATRRLPPFPSRAAVAVVCARVLSTQESVSQYLSKALSPRCLDAS